MKKLNKAVKATNKYFPTHAYIKKAIEAITTIEIVEIHY